MRFVSATSGFATWANATNPEVSGYSGFEGGVARQLSGTNVMPDFCGTGAAFPGTGGTTVRVLQEGQVICRPEYWSSHSRCCPQCEQLNLNWLIRPSWMAAWSIVSNGAIVQLLLPFHGIDTLKIVIAALDIRLICGKMPHRRDLI
jgi:hypothetical protein